MRKRSLSRGFHTGDIHQAPVLRSVTWKPLPYLENNLHRGYTSGLILEGEQFSPGVTVGKRFTYQGSVQESWNQPTIYFGDYLEISTGGGDADEITLGYRQMQFAVKNPNGKQSEWVAFSYPFELERLTAIFEELTKAGESNLNTNTSAAVENFRKAMTFARGLFGDADERTAKAHSDWQEALRSDRLSRLRFREGDRLRVVAEGPYQGQMGTVQSLYLGHLKAYYVSLDGIEEPVQFADNEVDAA